MLQPGTDTCSGNAWNRVLVSSIDFKSPINKRYNRETGTKR